MKLIEELPLTKKDIQTVLLTPRVIVSLLIALIGFYVFVNGVHTLYIRCTNPDISLQDYRDLEENDFMDDIPLVLEYFCGGIINGGLILLFSSSFYAVPLSSALGRKSVFETEITAKRKWCSKKTPYNIKYMLKTKDREYFVSLSDYYKTEEGMTVRLHVIVEDKKIKQLLGVEFPPFE